MWAMQTHLSSATNRYHAKHHVGRKPSIANYTADTLHVDLFAEILEGLKQCSRDDVEMIIIPTRRKKTTRNNC